MRLTTDFFDVAGGSAVGTVVRQNRAELFFRGAVKNRAATSTRVAADIRIHGSHSYFLYSTQYDRLMTS